MVSAKVVVKPGHEPDQLPPPPPLLLTTSASVALVEFVLLASPVYLATMLCVPTAIFVIGQAAVAVVPLLLASATALQPLSEVPPSVKPTVPVGAVPVTVAVIVTLAPAVAGLAELARLVVEAVWVEPHPG
jgi:hypothetical protein